MPQSLGIVNAERNHRRDRWKLYHIRGSRESIVCFDFIRPKDFQPVGFPMEFLIADDIDKHPCRASAHTFSVLLHRNFLQFRFYLKILLRPQKFSCTKSEIKRCRYLSIQIYDRINKRIPPVRGTPRRYNKRSGIFSGNSKVRGVSHSVTRNYRHPWKHAFHCR